MVVARQNVTIISYKPLSDLNFARCQVHALFSIGVYKPLIIYIDDILLMADTEQKATFALLLILDVLEFMGFLVNYEKSVLIPSQKIEFFGIPSEFSRHVHCTTTGEDSKNLRTDSVTSSQSNALGQRDRQNSRDSQLMHPGCHASSTSLPCSASHKEPSNSCRRLRPPDISPSHSESRIALVVPTSHISQWETNNQT